MHFIIYVFFIFYRELIPLWKLNMQNIGNPYAVMRSLEKKLIGFLFEERPISAYLAEEKTQKTMSNNP